MEYNFQTVNINLIKLIHFYRINKLYKKEKICKFIYFSVNYHKNIHTSSLGPLI